MNFKVAPQVNCKCNEECITKHPIPPNLIEDGLFDNDLQCLCHGTHNHQCNSSGRMSLQTTNAYTLKYFAHALNHMKVKPTKKDIIAHNVDGIMGLENTPNYESSSIVDHVHIM